jgi:hypothetical protein
MTTFARLLAITFLAALVSAEPAKVAGKWNVTLLLVSFTGHPVIRLKQDGEILTGTYEGRYGVSDLKGSVKDNAIEFTVVVLAEGTRVEGVFGGKVDGDSMGGTVEFEGAGDGTWSAVRVKQH